MGSSSPRIGVKIPKIFELPPPRPGMACPSPWIRKSPHLVAANKSLAGISPFFVNIYLIASLTIGHIHHVQ